MRFRPGPVSEGDPHPGSEVEWADNWLSNSLAWFSTKWLPAWCQSEDHWTAKTTQYLFTDCPCCLLFRGIVVGTTATLAVVMLVAVVFLLTLEGSR